MAVHEIATNAAKHGALSAPRGTLAISWFLEGGGLVPRLLHLSWIERGGPPVSGRPTRNGFGSQLLSGTVEAQLGGTLTLSWDSHGLTCRMALPLDALPE